MKRGTTSRIVTTLAFAFVALIQVKSQEPSDDAAWQRYQHISRNSTLEWLHAEPFLLKVEYQLYDLDGKPVEKGVAEESWTESGEKHVRIQSPSLVIGDAPPADEYAAHTRENYLVHQALSALTRPFLAPTEHKDFAMDEFHQTLAGSDLSCFSLVQLGKTRTPNSPTYCTDADNHITAMTGPLFVIERSDFRKVREHEIPNDLKLFYEGKPAITLHVTELDSLPVTSVPQSETKSVSASTHLPAEVVAGLILKRKDPKYPALAKAAHMQGVVFISAIITKQGTIAGLDVIASPHKILTQAARDAVQNWTYRPYLLNGLPTEVETTITVNFAFGK
jgi:TonB family protein